MRNLTPIDPGFPSYEEEKVVGQLVWNSQNGQYIVLTEDLDGRITEHRLRMDEVETLRQTHKANEQLEEFAGRETEYRRIAGMADRYESQEAEMQFIAAAHQGSRRK